MVPSTNFTVMTLFSGTVVHPAKSADEYDLEDDDKVDLFVFVPRTVGHRKKKRKREVEESYENPVTKYFAIKRMNSSLTEGDEGKLVFSVLCEY